MNDAGHYVRIINRIVKLVSKSDICIFRLSRIEGTNLNLIILKF